MIGYVIFTRDTSRNLEIFIGLSTACSLPPTMQSFTAEHDLSVTSMTRPRGVEGTSNALDLVMPQVHNCYLMGVQKLKCPPRL